MLNHVFRWDFSVFLLKESITSGRGGGHKAVKKRKHPWCVHMQSYRWASSKLCSSGQKSGRRKRWTKQKGSAPVLSLMEAPAAATSLHPPSSGPSFFCACSRPSAGPVFSAALACSRKCVHGDTGNRAGSEALRAPHKRLHSGHKNEVFSGEGTGFVRSWRRGPFVQTCLLGIFPNLHLCFDTQHLIFSSHQQLCPPLTFDLWLCQSLCLSLSLTNFCLATETHLNTLVKMTVQMHMNMLKRACLIQCSLWQVRFWFDPHQNLQNYC